VKRYGIETRYSAVGSRQPAAWYVPGTAYITKISEWIQALKKETGIRYKIIFRFLKRLLSKQTEKLKT
jgi:hypothetical protein